MESHKSPSRSARSLVILNCIVFLAFGCACLLDPARVARAVDIELGSASAFADLRAMYGGLCLAIAGLLWRGLRDPAWFAASLFLTATTSAGLAAGRVYSIAVSGMPNELVLVGGLGVEVVSLCWALWAYRSLQTTARPVQQVQAAS